MSDDDPTVPAGPLGYADSPAPDTLVGRFATIRVLGSGGMGVVLEAYDPDLDRRVAIKLLHSGRGVTHLQREAQAMAKLSHPNVVAVYDVGRFDDQTFIAMELVEGQTLRAWIREPRPWRETVAMLLGAGRGLAAAHAAGLVHRDVKPENILVGMDGRARVTDFGLVSTMLHGSETPAGTPAYMSPEHWTGAGIDERSDQFSFCATLWEALWRQHPFAVEQAAALRDAVRDGRIVPPPDRPTIPGWLETALRRGLAPDPAARWPSMAALLDNLEARSAGNRGAFKYAGLVAGVLSLGLIAAIATGGEPDVCPSPDARAAAVWSEARRDALRDALIALDPSLGQQRFDTVAAVFDRGVADWRVQHVAACKATHVDGRQSDTMLDQRMRCLDRWLREVDRSVGSLEELANRPALDRAVGGITNLSTPASCADLALSAPPAGADARAEAQAIQDELDAMHLAMNAGALEDAPARARAVVERARQLDHPATLAAALRGASELLREMDAPREDLLEELTRAAAVAGDDRSAAYAWVMLVRLRGGDLDHPEQAEALYASADAAVLRAGDPPALRFDLHLARAVVLDDTDRAEEALLLLDQAAALIAATDAETLPATPGDYQSRLAFARGRALQALGEREPAIAAYRAAIAQRRDLLGPDHPDVAKALINLGETLRELGRTEDAAEAYEEAARIVEARIGESGMLAMVLNRVASTYWSRERADLALPIYQRSVAIGDAHLDPGHPFRASLHADLATALVDLDRRDEALAEYTLAISLDEQAGRETNNAALGLANRARLLVKLGRHDEALRDYRRAIDLLDRIGTGDHYLSDVLLGEGHALLAARRPREAVPVLERAASLLDPETSAHLAPLIRFDLGRAKVESKQDVRGGLAEARAARASVDADDVMPDALSEMDAWLTKRAR